LNRQYWGDYKQQGGTLSGQYMRSLYDDIANAIKSKLPKALISWDISPWISENDMRTWWGFFSDSKNVDIVCLFKIRINLFILNLKSIF
jgi:hypothetical protein